MLSKKKGIIVLSLMLLVAVMAGCSGDSTTTELIEGVEGPDQVIVGVESDEFVATGETGSSYIWEVAGANMGIFTAPNDANTKFIPSEEAAQYGTVNISVMINNTEKNLPSIEVLKNESKTEYAEGTFHAIVTTSDKKREGYIAAGTIGPLALEEAKNPYMVKADNRGLIIDQKEFDRDGRFYDVQDIAHWGLGDSYYLIGYGEVSSGFYKSFVLKLNNKMEIEEEYNPEDEDSQEDQVTTKVYLRSGIVSTHVFTSDYIVAVGNYDDGETVLPYITKINIADGSDKEDYYFLNEKDTTLSNPYYNLESIVETDDGYIAVGYTGNSRNDSDGILLTLNSDFQIKTLETDFGSKLYKIKEVSQEIKNNKNVEFVVVGDNGYIAEVDSNGNIANSTKLESGLVFRDVIVDGTDYVVVGEEDKEQGVVVKIKSGSSNYTYKQNYGRYLYGVAKATDNDYLLAGHSADENSYVVKVDSNLEVVKRVKE